MRTILTDTDNGQDGQTFPKFGIGPLSAALTGTGQSREGSRAGSRRCVALRVGGHASSPSHASLAPAALLEEAQQQLQQHVAAARSKTLCLTSPSC